MVSKFYLHMIKTSRLVLDFRQTSKTDIVVDGVS